METDSTVSDVPSEAQETTTTTETTDVVTLKKSDLQKLIDEAIATEITGLKNKNVEVILENKKLKDQLAKTPKVDENELKELQQFKRARKQDEILELVTSGKRDEAIEKLTAGIKAEHNATLDAINAEAAKAKADADAYRKRFHDERVRAEIGQAATSVKTPYLKFVQSELKERIVFDEDTGAVSVLGDDGKILFDKNQRPITVSEHIESLRSKYPEFFNTPTGGGAVGSQKVSTKGKIYTHEEAERLPFEEFKKAQKERRIQN